MDVLLINLPTKMRTVNNESLALNYLAGYVRPLVYEVGILDGAILNLSYEQIIKEVCKIKPKIIGLTLYFSPNEHENNLKFISDLKRHFPKSHLTLGGYFPTFYYQELLEGNHAIDSIVLGEGEVTFAELVKLILDSREWRGIDGIAFREGSKVVRNQSRKLIDNLDDIPFAARDYLKVAIAKREPISIISSRGCTAQCHFCSVAHFYGIKSKKRWRPRSPENILKEMKTLSSHWEEGDVRHFDFVDDNFIGGSIERVSKFAKMLVQEGTNYSFSLSCRVTDVEKELFSLLKKAGLTSVFLGVESAVPRVLKDFNKQTTMEANVAAIYILKELGIKINIGFIMFDPTTNLDEVMLNLDYLDFVKDEITVLNMVDALSNRLRVFVGSNLEKIYSRKGILQVSDNSEFLKSYHFKERKTEILYDFIRQFRADSSNYNPQFFDIIKSLVIDLHKAKDEENELKSIIRSYTATYLRR